jgi:flagellar biosynthesis protein FlhB
MERTEKATPKKRRDTRERGRVAQSRDLSSALALTGCIAALYMFYPLIVEALTGSMTRAITQRIEDDMFTVSGIQRVLLSSALSFIKAAAPPVVAAAVVGAFAGYLQVGFLFASKPFQPDFNQQILHTMGKAGHTCQPNCARSPFDGMYQPVYFIDQLFIRRFLGQPGQQTFQAFQTLCQLFN